MGGGKYHFQAAHKIFSRTRVELTRIITGKRGLISQETVVLRRVGGELYYMIKLFYQMS